MPTRSSLTMTGCHNCYSHGRIYVFTKLVPHECCYWSCAKLDLLLNNLRSQEYKNMSCMLYPDGKAVPPMLWDVTVKNLNWSVYKFNIVMNNVVCISWAKVGMEYSCLEHSFLQACSFFFMMRSPSDWWRSKVSYYILRWQYQAKWIYHALLYHLQARSEAAQFYRVKGPNEAMEGLVIWFHRHPPKTTMLLFDREPLSLHYIAIIC